MTQGDSPRVAIPWRWLLLGALPLVLVVAGFLFWQQLHHASASSTTESSPAAPAAVLLPTETNPMGLPSAVSGTSASGNSAAIRPIIELHTAKPSRPNDAITTYTVQQGDSVFSIAGQLGLKPTTIAWANISALMAGAGMLSPGQVLKIPPLDGVYYQWQAGDTLPDVANRFGVSVESILSFPSNNLNPLNPQILPGDYIMVPGGTSSTVNWAGPVSVTENVSYNTFLGPNGCGGTTTGSPGTGAWVWPAPDDTSHLLSGNNFSSWHPGVDILELLGWPIEAADKGVVTYAGWSVVGYGNLVIINHLDGWETYYAHLNYVGVECGVQVVGGEEIGTAGTTGNSTGPHLHFEMHYNGSPVDPHTIYQIIP